MHKRILWTFLLSLLSTSILAIQNPAQAQPIPSLLADNTFYSPFPGQDLEICFTQQNNGDQDGFRPVIELVVPIDLTFDGAQFLGVEVDHESYLIPASGELTYSIGAYERTVEGQPGAEVIVLYPPVNHIAPGEVIPEVCAQFTLSEEAVIGHDYLINGTLIFAYGTDPLDNPNADPPQVSGPTQVTVRPNLIRVRKGLDEALWSADVVPTGPNYAFNYTITVSLARRLFDNLTIKDLLPEEAIFVRLVEVRNLTDDTEVFDYVLESEPVPGQYGGNLTLRIPRVWGNAGDTISVTVSMYFPFYDSGGDELIGFTSTRDVRNDVEASVIYEGDLYPATNNTIITASSNTYEKSVKIYVDNYAEGISRFDIVEYTVRFWVSDYYNVSVIEFSDTLGDGQAVLRNMTPVFHVVNGSSVYSGEFPSDAYEYGDDHSNPDKTTPLFFNVTRALGELYGKSKLVGGMVGNESWTFSGGEFNPPFGRGRTWGYIKFWALVERDYTNTVPSGDQQIDSGDFLPNEVLETAKYGSDSFTPPDIGRRTRLDLPVPKLTKRIAYVNGNPPTSPIYVRAGDNVTFELKIEIPTANADSLEFYDELPLPVFMVDYSGGGQTPFYVDQPNTSTVPPPPGQWAIGPDDNVTSVTGLKPRLFLVDTTANKLGFKYDGPIHAGNNTLLVVDVMYTLTVTDYPFDDLLDLADLATEKYGNSFTQYTESNSIRFIVTQSPHLVIDKTITQTTGGSIVGDDRVEGADAGDTVTFQVSVTNDGHWEAHDVIIRDDLQEAGDDYWRDLQNLGVYHCDGATEWDPASYTLTVSQSYDSPQYLELSLNDNVVLEPDDCIVLRYDLTLTQSVYPRQTLINNGSIIQYASVEGGQNFVDPNDLPTDDASVIVAPPSLTKSLESSNQDFTDGDVLAVGEEAVFSVRVTLPEGTTSNLVINDTLPEGFTYAGATPQDSVDVDTTGFSGSLPSYTVSYDSDYRNLTIEFSGDASVTNNNDAGDNSFTVKVHLRVDNSYSGWVPSTTTWTRTNMVSMNWTGNPGPEPSAEYDVEVGTPKVVVRKEFLNEDYTSYTPKDAGDYVVMKLKMVNRGYLDAFDIQLTDELGDYVDLSTFTLDSQSAPPGVSVSWGLSSNTLTVTVDHLPGNTAPLSERTVELYFKFRLADDVIAGWTYGNHVSHEYTTLPGTSDYEKSFSGSRWAYLTIKEPDVEKDVYSTSNPDTSGDELAIREEVVFDVAVNLPEGNLSDMTLVDEWPEGFQYLNHTLDTSGLAGSVPTPTVTVDGVNRKLTIQFPGWTHVDADNDPTNDLFYLKVAFRVLDDTSNSGYPTKGEKTNQVTLSWNDKQVTADRTVYLVEPHLTVTKSFNVSSADAGDWVELTISLENDGFSPAYNVNLTDVLDPSVFDPSTVTEVSTPTGFTYSFNPASGQVSYEGGEIGVGETLTFRVDAMVRLDVTALSTYVNQADANGSSMPDHLEGERIYDASGQDTLAIGVATLSKALVETSEPSTPGSKVTVGEIVIFDLTSTVPEGVTRNVTFYDILPKNSEVLMLFMNANVTVSKENVESSEVTLTPGSWTPITPTQSDNVLAFYLGDITNSNSDAEQESVTVRVKLLILNEGENSAGKQLVNRFKVGYTNASNDYVYTSEAESTLTVVEPQLWSILTANPISVGWSGDQVVLHFNVTNLDTSTSSIAYDLQLIESLPSQFSNLEVIQVDTSSAGTITDLSTPDQLKLLASYLEPRGWINVTFRIVLQPNAVFGQSIPLQACADGTTTPGDRGSWNEVPGDPGDNDGERTGTGTEPNHIRTCDDASVTVGTPNINKDVLTPKARYAPGDQVRYQITIGTPKGSTSDLKVVDTLAEGLQYSDDLKVEVPSGVTFSNTPRESAPFFSHTDTGTTETITFDFGSFTNSNSIGVNTYVRFNATVEDHSDNVDGKTLENSATLYYKDSSNEEQSVGPATVSITVGEPHLASPSKTALNDLEGGQWTWFILSFVNDGTTTAYDTVVKDNLPPELRGATPVVSYIKVGDRTLSPSDYSVAYYDSNGTLALTFKTPDEDSDARIEPGESVEIKIGVQAIQHVPLEYTAMNTFEVREYSSRPGVVDQERTYTGGSASATVSSPGPEVRKVVFSTVTSPPDPSDPTRSRAVVGEIIYYNVTFRMPPGTVAYDVTFRDSVPDGLEVINATAVGVNATGPVTGTTSVTESSGRYTVEASFGRLADAEVNVTIYARVRYYYSDGSTPLSKGDTLVNGNSTNPSYYSWSNGVETRQASSNQVSTEIVGSYADLRIEKSFSPKLIRFGENTTATIRVTNEGNGTSYQTVLRDVFCDSFQYVEANVTPNSVSGDTIVWELGELRPGETWAVNVTFNLKSCGCLNDNATVSWVDPGHPADEKSARASDEVDVVTELEFEKPVEPDHPRVGQQAVFILLVRNPTCRIARNLNFTDELPAGMEYVRGSSELNETAIDDPSISGGELVWNTSLVVNPGETYLLRFTAKAAPGAEGGRRTNFAGAYGVDQRGVPINATDTADLIIRGEEGGLEVNKEVSRREVAVNDTVTFTIAITNHWNVPLYDVDVWDLLPACLEYEGGSTVGGYPVEPSMPSSPPPGHAIVTTTLPAGAAMKKVTFLKWHIDSIDPGETVEIQFTAKATCSGVLTNVAEVNCRTEGGEGVHASDSVDLISYSVPSARASASSGASGTGVSTPAGSGSVRVETQTQPAGGSPTETAASTEASSMGESPARTTGGEVTGPGPGASTGAEAGETPTSASPPKPVTSSPSEVERAGTGAETWLYLLVPALLVLLLLSVMILRRRRPRRGGFG